MKKYQCHKQVEAAKIIGATISEEDATKAVVHLDGGEDLEVHGDFVMKHMLNGRDLEENSGLYLVRYADGYLSVSPAAPFEEGYTEIEAE